VGSLTLSRFLLIACLHLLEDKRENVVYEMIATLNKLLEYGLLLKEDCISSYKSIKPLLK